MFFDTNKATVTMSSDDARKQALLLHGHADLLTQLASAADAKRDALKGATDSLEAALKALKGLI